MRRACQEYKFLCLIVSACIGLSLVGLGCSHTPARPMELDQARAAYGEVRDNPQVANSAPVPLREAEEALLRAEQTWDQTKNVEETQNLAAVAKQRTEIVRVAAAQK